MWEYKVEKCVNAHMSEARLVELGRKNWELVTIIHLRPVALYYYFKRKLL